MRIAIGQMNIIPADIDKNLKAGLNLIQQAKEERCDLILLPEAWAIGFPFERLKELSKTTPEVLEELKKSSDSICICGTYVVDNRNSKKVFNIFYAIKNAKIVFEYKKTMLFGLTGEDRYFDRGDIKQENIFELNGIKIGVSVCYELRFPEFFRKTAIRGAVIHLNPALWPTNRLEHWRILSKTRAIENQFYLLTSNGTGKSGKWNLGGHSAIFNAWGNELKNLTHSTGMAFVDFDSEELKKIRNQLPSLEDSYKYFKELYSGKNF